MKFRPCIDLHNGVVKQIVGGSLQDDDARGPLTNFESDREAAYYARMYARDNLAGGHVIMLGPGNEAAACAALQAYPGGMQLGGGVTAQNARHYLDAGASHVIVTSYVFCDGQVQWKRLEELCAAVGSERVVLDLSCRWRGDAYYVVTDRWQKWTDVVVDAHALERFSARCDEFLVHAVDVEGRMAGVDEALLALLAQTAVRPITYAGGIRSIDDLELVDRCGQGRIDATVGSALDIFGGPLAYAEVVEWHRRRNAPK